MKAMWWSLLALTSINTALIGSQRGRHKLRTQEDFMNLFKDHGRRSIKLLEKSTKRLPDKARTIILLENAHKKKRIHRRHTDTKPNIPKILPLTNPQRKPKVLPLAALLTKKRERQQSEIITPKSTEPRIAIQEPVNIFIPQSNSSCQFVPRVLQLRALEEKRKIQDFLAYLNDLEK